MARTQPIDLSYSHEPRIRRGLTIADGERIVNGEFLAMNPDGYVVGYLARTDYRFLGFAEEEYTGDHSISPPPRVITAQGGGLLQAASVAGATSQASVDRKVYALNDDSLSLTPSHPGIPPIGVVETWHGGTTCHVRVFPAHHWPNGEVARFLASQREQERTYHDEDFLLKPYANDDIEAASEDDPKNDELAIVHAANPVYAVAGTNAAGTDAVHLDGGGVELTAGGTQNDETMLIPRSSPATATWLLKGLKPSLSGAALFVFETPETITDIIISAGIKLTATSTQATDNDSLYVMFDSGSGSENFRAMHSVGGVDSDPIDTGIKLEAETRYHVLVLSDSDGEGEVYLGTPGNMKLVASGLSMTAAAVLLPVIGVKTLEGSGADRKLIVRRAIAGMNTD